MDEANVEVEEEEEEEEDEEDTGRLLMTVS